jgi:hypothetical protein
VATLLASTLVACKSDDEKAVQLVEEMAALFDRNKSDCDKLGSEFDTFAADNTARFIDLKRVGRLQGEKRKAFEAAYGARLEAATRKLMDGAIPCMANPKVADALKRIR